MLQQSQDNLLRADELVEYQYEPASKASRFVNNFIDRIVAIFVTLTLGGMFSYVGRLFSGSEQISGLTVLAGVLVFPAYYIILEWKLGKTVGKMITKTRVINDDGGPISLGQAIGRFLCRFIPFDSWVVLFSSSGRGLHDSIADTWVVNDLPYNPLQVAAQQEST
ncbi:RDD family protein [Fibrella sp. HMF5335]|uniref:RDD family protein n=1 Tax=Fibrella rubiginis TaxID=2817060 RepID=A0A939GIF0_9BACT|nr:RDD family protein [Fibrella rubiginis]MBO0938881.1 RDD family protein [Fibrella rubiginis]